MAKYNTRQKNLLLSFLSSNSDTAFTIEQIVSELNGLSENAPAKSTVYRLIRELVEAGAVKRFVKGNSRQFLYQSSGGEECRHHLHLKCISCGKLLHMEHKLSDKLLKDILGQDSFSVECERTTLFGHCRECSVKSDKKRGNHND